MILQNDQPISGEICICFVFVNFESWRRLFCHEKVGLCWNDVKNQVYNVTWKSLGLKMSNMCITVESSHRWLHKQKRFVLNHKNAISFAFPPIFWSRGIGSIVLQTLKICVSTYILCTAFIFAEPELPFGAVRLTLTWFYRYEHSQFS